MNFWKVTYFTHSEAYRTGFGSCGTSHTPVNHLPIFMILSLLVFAPQLPLALIQLGSKKVTAQLMSGFSIALPIAIYFQQMPLPPLRSQSGSFPHPDSQEQDSSFWTKASDPPGGARFLHTASAHFCSRHRYTYNVSQNVFQFARGHTALFF